MKSFFLGGCSLVMNYRYNPFRYLDMASKHSVIQVLGWLWSIIFLLSYLSVFYFKVMWSAYFLIAGAVFFTISVLKCAQSRSAGKACISNLSNASACVWQMDREA